MSDPFLECEYGTLYLGDSLEVMQGLNDNTIDSIVTDPPYGLTNSRPQVFKSVRDPSVNKGGKGFMGMEWDHGVPGPDYWLEAYRIAKPGAHMLVFGGTRTYHRLACAIEDAGWEIRDCIMWCYGSGFPKSLDIGKAIDKAAGATRAVTGSRRGNVGIQGGNFGRSPMTGTILKHDEPVTDNAKIWDGWGTALKPAWEPIIVARKPTEGTIAANILKYGTGAINVDGSRVALAEGEEAGLSQPYKPNYKNSVYGQGMGGGDWDNSKGRWPANLIHDGSEEVTDGFSENASRFFYCAKTSATERGDFNDHPTVKPQALMRYLCRLVTPPGGTVLDPFMGSGSTCLAAKEDHFKFVGIDKTPEYCEIAKQRLTISEGIFGL